MYDYFRLVFKIFYVLYFFFIYRFIWFVNCIIDYKLFKGRGCWKFIYFLYLLVENIFYVVFFLILLFLENRSNFVLKNVFFEKCSLFFLMVCVFIIIFSFFFI